MRQNWSRKNQNGSIFLWLCCLRSSENQIVRARSRSGRMNQSKFTFQCFVIGLALPLLLATPTTQFSLDHKWWSRKRNQNAFYTRLLSSMLLGLRHRCLSANKPLKTLFSRNMSLGHLRYCHHIQKNQRSQKIELSWGLYITVWLLLLFLLLYVICAFLGTDRRNQFMLKGLCQPRRMRSLEDNYLKKSAQRFQIFRNFGRLFLSVY